MYYTAELREKIQNDMKQRLSQHRYMHVLGVAQAARKLAEKYGGNADQAETAGLLHDAAKQLPLKEMQELACRTFGSTLPQEIMAAGSLLHGYAAVTIAKEQYQINDDELLSSLAHHTTGAEHMGLLEKIVFLADYIEIHRDFVGVEKLRDIAASDLDKAVLAGYDSTIYHLLEQGKTIYAGTVVNRNALIAELKKDGRL